MTRTPAPALTAEEARTVARFDAAQTPPEVAAVQYVVWGEWLVLDTGRHNCGVGPDGHYGAHEPGCGLEPVERVSVLLEVLAPVIADAEKRAAAAALREFADGIYIDEGTRYDDRVRIVAAAHRRAAALDPAGAVGGETT